MSVFIYEALRTARGKGKEGGALAECKPDELVASLIHTLQQRELANQKPAALLLGSVGQTGAQGGHIALQAKFRAGLDDSVAAFSLNNYCVSALTAVNQAAAMVGSGQCRSALAGGVEMMSRVPFMGDRADYYRDSSFAPRYRYLPVALAADRLAITLDVSREEMDQAALLSQQRSAAAEGSGLVKSRVAVNGLDKEECLRLASAEQLAAMEPAFAALAAHSADVLGGEIEHRHTVAHAPPMCDGAALAVIGAEDAMDAKPRARILATAETGDDPAAALTGGLRAMDRALAQAGLSLDNMDCIEFMEAFAVCIVNFMRTHKPDPERVNIGGGSMAKGHPMGATGGILLSSLLDTLDERQGRYGLVVVTGAAGIGSAMVVERIE